MKPMPEKLLQLLPGATQVVLVGNGKSYLGAVITGSVKAEEIQDAIDQVNANLPHYKQVRASLVRPESFSIEDGLLTANGKLKRDAIAKAMQNEIEDLYRVKVAV